MDYIHKFCNILIKLLLIFLELLGSPNEDKETKLRILYFFGKILKYDLLKNVLICPDLQTKFKITLFVLESKKVRLPPSLLMLILSICE